MGFEKFGGLRGMITMDSKATRKYAKVVKSRHDKNAKATKKRGEKAKLRRR